NRGRETINDADWDDIRRQAGRLGRHPCFQGWDPEDLQQALAVCLLQRLPAFDPAKGPRGPFKALVIARCAANLLRNQRVRHRHLHRTRSLQAPLAPGDAASVPLSEAVGQREQDARRGRWPRSPEEQAQLVSDVATVLDQLPADLRDLAVQLLT